MTKRHGPIISFFSICLISFFYLFFSLTLVFGSEETISSPKNTTKTVIDMVGRTVHVPVKISRIVAAGPGALRLICYMNAQGKVVGIEQSEKTWGPGGRPYALANPDLLTLPTIGPGGPGAINSGPDPELILKVKPDVIFITYMEKGKADEYQEKVNLPVVVLSYGKLATFDEKVYDSLKIIGKILNSEKKAESVITFLKTVEEPREFRTVKDQQFM